MRISINRYADYKVPGWGKIPTTCDVEIARFDNSDKVLVVVTDINENEGPSVINNMGKIADTITDKFLSEERPENVIFVETGTGSGSSIYQPHLPNTFCYLSPDDFENYRNGNFDTGKKK